MLACLCVCYVRIFFICVYMSLRMFACVHECMRIGVLACVFHFMSVCVCFLKGGRGGGGGRGRGGGGGGRGCLPETK